MPVLDKATLVFDITNKHLFLIVVILTIVYYVLQLAIRARSPLRNIRLPPSWPIVRHTVKFLLTKDITHVYLDWFRFAKEDGIFRYYGLLGREVVAVFKPEFIKQILVTKSKKYERTGHLKQLYPSAGNGVFTSNGYDHAWQRKLMNPLFSYTSTKRYLNIFDKHVEDLVKFWSKSCFSETNNTSEVSVSEDLTHISLDVIGETAFGYHFNSVLEGSSDASDAFENMLSGKLGIANSLFRRFIPFWDQLPIARNLEYKKAVTITDNIIHEIIKQKRDNSCEGDNDENEAVDLLSVMMKLQDEDTGERMTDQLLKENIWTLLLAGHETTSGTLTWALYHLAMDHVTQEKARDEAQSVLGDCEALSPEHVDKLRYITGVIKETLRITPAAAMTMRRCVEEDKIGHYIIPKETLINIPILGIHMYEEYWSQPWKFQPERFINPDDTTSAGITGQTYIPFSSGPRSCLGTRFAMMEMKVLLAKLLCSFRFDIGKDHPEVAKKVLLTLKSNPPPRLLLTSLKKED